MSDPSHTEEDTKLTIVTKQEVGLDPIDGDWSNGSEIVSLVNELEVRVGRVEKTLSVERFQIDDLESFRASNTELGFEEVDGARFGGDVELLCVREVRRVNG